MSMRIAEAITPEDREAVYRFRYRVYVEEMGRPQKYADHAWKRIEEPLDGHAHVLAAFNGDHLVGTVRYNLGSEGGFDYYEELYGLRSFGPFFPDHVSITTKLMVAPECRRSTLALRLASECYRGGAERGSMFDVIDCNPPLRPFFAKLGYRQISSNFEHPEYGHVIPMVLALYDDEHLAAVRSPFLAEAAQRGPDRGSVVYFRSALLNRVPNDAKPAQAGDPFAMAIANQTM